jgi:hypothetical protein
MITIDHDISSVDIGKFNGILFEERYPDDGVEMEEW